MQTQIAYTQIMAMEQRKRAHLINSAGGFKSVCLIGTSDNLGNTNLAIFSSVVHIGATPPLISFIMRPDSVERHTLESRGRQMHQLEKLRPGLLFRRINVLIPVHNINVNRQFSRMRRQRLVPLCDLGIPLRPQIPNRRRVFNQE